PSMPALVVALDQNVNSIQHVTSVMQQLVSTVNELRDEVAQLRSSGATNNSNAHITVPNFNNTSEQNQPTIISKPITNSLCLPALRDIKTLERVWSIYTLGTCDLPAIHSLELNGTVGALKDTSAKAKAYSRFKGLISVIKDYACANCLAPGDAAEQLDFKRLQLQNKSLNHFLDYYRAGKIK
ncbi:hypothetical protein ROZALSC1DRAFT_26164, partial [Rozella allomycis CSF55]